MKSRLPGPGDVITIARHDHYMGTEDLSMRVKLVGNGQPLPPALEWVTVEGTALNVDGSDRGHLSALVRLAALDMPEPADHPVPTDRLGSD